MSDRAGAPAATLPFDISDQLSARLAQLGQEHCVFTRHSYTFALAVSAAREVLIGEASTPVPQAPPALAGVLNLRGEVLPLVKLDDLLDLPPRPYESDDQILVVSYEGIDLGLVVDRVRDVRPINPNDIIPLPDTVPQHPLFKGAWETQSGTVILLDAKGIVSRAVAVVSDGFRDYSGTWTT